MRDRHSLVITGAGPAGLAAAHEAIRRDLQSIALEKADQVGGLARTETYQGYRFNVGAHLETIRSFLVALENLQTIGCNGMHRYNNMDHSMLSGMLAVSNLFGENHALWGINLERSYHEDGS